MDFMSGQWQREVEELNQPEDPPSGSFNFYHRMIPTDFDRHARGDNRRFHVRELTSCRECGPQWQVYGLGLIHLAMCDSVEAADMIADALEFSASFNEMQRSSDMAASLSLIAATTRWDSVTGFGWMLSVS